MKQKTDEVERLWKQEKEILEYIRTLRSEIEELKNQALNFEREGNF